VSSKPLLSFFGFALATLASVVILILGWNGESGRQVLDSLEATSLSGSVGDGPLVGATVNVTNSRGELLGSKISDNTGTYKVRIRTKRKDYPLTIEATGGFDLVTGYESGFKLVSTALNRSQKRKINLNPFSTLITKTVLAMPGGLNEANLSATKAIISRQLSFGLDPILVPDPVHSRVSVKNLADIVKASEVLAEMIRRTRKALVVAGYDLDDDQVFDTLAHDLSDGVIDGRGTGADALIAATANIVSGQVLLEALTNHLRVDDAEATLLMDRAIIMTMPSATKMTGDVLITEQVIRQAQIAVAATQAILPSAELSELDVVLQDLPVNNLAGMIEPLLPDQANLLFDPAILYVVTATADELEAVNAMVRDRVKDEVKAPTVQLSADNSSVAYNGTVTVRWVSTDADTCTASGAWSGEKELSGNESIGPLTADSSFVLSCTGQGGETTARVMVDVMPPPPTVTLMADMTSVAYNGAVMLSWVSSNADVCTASGAWSGTKELSGKESIGGLISDSRFVLNCVGAGGEANASVSVEVLPSSPTVTLTADTPSVVYNGEVTLNWSTTNATSCTASGAWSGVKGLSGSESIGSLTADSSFVLSCSGAGGEASAAVAVSVQPPPLPTVTLMADTTSVAYNGAVTLNWSTTNATSCTASGAWSGVKELSGSESIGSLTSDSSFVLSCSGAGGEASAAVAVSVQSPLPLPTVNLAADTTSVSYNGAVILSWSTTNATSCTASGAWSGVKDLSGSESISPLTSDSSFSLNCIGPSGTASETVEISCSNCTTDFQITLLWDKNLDFVTGYKVYKGASTDMVSEVLSDIPLETQGFDPETPSISYHVRDDLGLALGEDQCFKVKAYNDYGLSEFSGVACTDLW
jgi:hypothetical protein